MVGRARGPAAGRGPGPGEGYVCALVNANPKMAGANKSAKAVSQLYVNYISKYATRRLRSEAGMQVGRAGPPAQVRPRAGRRLARAQGGDVGF